MTSIPSEVRGWRPYWCEFEANGVSRGWVRYAPDFAHADKSFRDALADEFNGNARVLVVKEMHAA